MANDKNVSSNELCLPFDLHLKKTSTDVSFWKNIFCQMVLDSNQQRSVYKIK